VATGLDDCGKKPKDSISTKTNLSADVAQKFVSQQAFLT